MGVVSFPWAVPETGVCALTGEYLGGGVGLKHLHAASIRAWSWFNPSGVRLGTKPAASRRHGFKALMGDPSMVVSPRSSNSSWAIASAVGPTRMSSSGSAATLPWGSTVTYKVNGGRTGWYNQGGKARAKVAWGGRVVVE